ncbi:MAG: DEAD/DEAH box helicase family protein [Candidatus Izemoplasmatales bacterium]|nr:DEAD/DEAH box helicase family protein [Candidatus Izemoplasmatales bacterium]
MSDQDVSKFIEKIKYLESKVDYLEHLLAKHNIPYAKNYTLDIKANLSNQEKLKIYKDYFKGRSDCYAMRWERDDKSGYTPAYLPSVKYLSKEEKSKLSNKNLYEPLNDEVVIAHLTGKETIGLYPILEDQTCHFLAFDFDEKSWKSDVINLSQTLNHEHISHLIEISRSGKGSHLWMFFEQPVISRDARKLGRFLLTKTMMTYGMSNFTSYDRMFPAQDIIEKDGIGNLIALPLQGKSGKQGKTLFVDQNFQVYENQYERIQSTQKISLIKLNELLSQISKIDELGLYSEKAKDIDMDLFDIGVDELEIKIYNQIIIHKSRLSAKAIQFFKRASSIVNPEFYKKQNMRMSTYGISRIIELYEEDNQDLYLPVGTLNFIKESLDKYKVIYNFLDLRSKPKMKSKYQFQGILTVDQQNVLEHLLTKQSGVLIAPTGFGKTVIGIALAASLRLKTLIIVHRGNIAEQWREKFKTFLTIEHIGKLDKDYDTLGFDVDIALIQSLSKYNKLDEISNQYGLILIDEVHHLASPSYERCVRKFSAKHIIGLTATLKRSDGLEKIITTMIGPVIIDVSDINHEMNKHLYTRLTNFKLTTMGEVSIQDAYKQIIDRKERNEFILNDVKELIENGKNMLILTDRIDHLECLKKEISTYTTNLLCIHGRMSMKERLGFSEQLGSVNDGFIILATGKYIGEGFDDDRLDTLILTMPFRWRGTLQQYIGRLTRRKQGKDEISVYDYADIRSQYFSSMYLERLKGYKKMGFTIATNMDIESAIYHVSDYQQKLYEDLSKAKDIVFLIKQSVESKIDELINMCIVLPTLLSNKEMISNMIIIDKRYIWYGAINPFVFAHGKDDDILRYEDVLLAKQLIEEAEKVITVGPIKDI